MLYPKSIGSSLIATAGGYSNPTACAPAAGDDDMNMLGFGTCDVIASEFVVDVKLVEENNIFAIEFE